jgi:hypothetical protein
LIVHLRRGNREAGILLIPVILQSLSIYIQVGLFFVSQVPDWTDTSIRVTAVLFRYPAGPFSLSLDQLGSLLYVLSLAVIIVLRSTRICRQQALLEGEMAAAALAVKLTPEEIATLEAPCIPHPVLGFSQRTANSRHKERLPVLGFPQSAAMNETGISA